MIKKARYTRIVSILLAALFSALEAGAQSRSIETGRASASVGELMRAIEEQTEFRFSYNKELFDVSRTIALPAPTLPLEEALAIITAGQGAKHVIYKHYIAIVPAAAESRPQVRSAAKPRTSDIYTNGTPDPLDVPPRPKAEATEIAAERAPVDPLQPPTPAKEHYSDYTPVAVHANAPGRLPRFALKTNLLYGVTLTPDIAVEAALSPRWTIEAAYSYNPWNRRARAAGTPVRKLLHGIARIEARYWFCERFNGHFLAIHGLYSEYNVGGLDIPLLFERAYRYRGNAWGGGVAYGYDVPIGGRWNVEFTVGVGVYAMRYDRYDCLSCSTGATPVTRTWVGPSRLGISLEFLIR